MHASSALRTACQAATAASRAASTRSPILWTYLPGQIPYERGLLLQESLVQARLSAKAALRAAEASEWEADRVDSLKRVADTDVLLLLQHTPVFTAGRREKDPEQLEQEGARLRALGADYVHAMRGGQTTYHGPGQLVGYSLMDIGAAQVCAVFSEFHWLTLLTLGTCSPALDSLLRRPPRELPRGLHPRALRPRPPPRTHRRLHLTHDQTRLNRDPHPSPNLAAWIQLQRRTTDQGVV